MGFKLHFFSIKGKCYSQISNNVDHRAVGRSEDPEVPVLFGGHNLPPLVEIDVTALPKSGGATTPLAPPGTTLVDHKHSDELLLNYFVVIWGQNVHFLKMSPKPVSSCLPLLV